MQINITLCALALNNIAAEEIRCREITEKMAGFIYGINLSAYDERKTLVLLCGYTRFLAIIWKQKVI